MHERWTGLEHIPHWIRLFIQTGEAKLLEHGAAASPSPLLAAGWNLIRNANDLEQPDRLATETFLKHLQGTEARPILQHTGRWDWAMAWWLAEAARLGGDMGLDVSVLIRLAYPPLEYTGDRAFQWRRPDSDAYRHGPFSPYHVTSGQVHSLAALHSPRLNSPQ